MESYAEAVILWSRAILRGDRPAALRHRRELDRLTPINSRDHHLDNLRHVLDEVMEGLSEAEGRARAPGSNAATPTSASRWATTRDLLLLTIVNCP